MKKLTKLFSLMLVICCMCISSVNAANYNPHTITIMSETFGHTFEAYQIFKGDLSDGKLTNVEWGLSIQYPESLMNELKSKNLYINCDNAMDVAKVLESASASDVDDFANVVTKYMNSAPVGSANYGVIKQDNYYHYTMSVAGDGYYLVKDRDNSVSGNDAYTKYILEVVGDVSVIAKSDYPTLTKTLEDGEVYHQAAIGENVSFVLESRVPEMDGYEKYYFIIEDVYGDAFTFNRDVKVMIGEDELVLNEDFNVIEEEGSFKIEFIDFIDYADVIDRDILVTYSCMLDEDAISGTVGNMNSASLTYSNNPNFDYKGENSPKTGEPVGKTVDSTTTTYVTDLIITKVDGNSRELLSNAIFNLTSSSLNKVVYKEGVYTESETGKYYRLKDGSYTSSLPTQATSSLYESLETKYKLSYVLKVSDALNGEEVNGMVDESGTLVFKGLKAGTYTISELVAPEGYNKLENPIQVTIEWNKPTSGNECSWIINGSATTTGITVENFAGTTLPSTGGMGTVIFYVIGSCFVLMGIVFKKK